MAKKKEKTLEEKLQEALVPENQWPYILPENWCWTRLGKITNVVGGGTPSSSKKEYYDNGTIPWLSPADLSGYSDIYISRGQKNITELGLSKSSARLMPKDTVLLSSRAPIGYVAIASNSISTNQGFKNFLPSDAFYSRFLYWYLKSSKSLLESYASGTTFLELSGSKASMVEFPLPPLPEQKRIVHRIESLFAKLDEAKEKIQQVLDGAEMRKAAILHKAFTGELTKTWRKENSVSVSELLKNISEKLLKVKKKKIKKVSNLYSQRNIPHEWTWVELDDIAYKITDGEHATPKRVDNFCGFYLLSARNVRNDELKLDYVDYVAEDEYIRISKRCNPHMGDVLISCSGSVGRCCVITDNEKYVMVRSAAVISPILCNPKFIMYMIMSRDVQAQIKSLCKQTAQANLFIGAIASIKIPLPSLEEQDYISDLVGELFYKEKCSVEHCSKILFE